MQYGAGPTTAQVDYRVTRSVGYMALLPIRACLNPVRPRGTGRSGTRLFMVVRSVPSSSLTNRVWVHPESLASPARPLPTITFCAFHGTATACWCAKHVHLHLL